MAAHSIAVLLSGRGSNLKAVLDTAQRDQWAQTLDAGVVAVISNRADAAGLQIARAAGIATAVVAHADFPTRPAFEAALASALDAHSPTLVVLAGFMRVLSPSFVARYPGRIINIHPSLLPVFPGLKTHRRALEAGVRIHGATVHFVTADVDAGAVIAQAALAVQPADDEASLAARVLALEHQLLPRVIRLMIENRVRLDGTRVVLRNVGAGELAQFAQ